MAPSTIEIELRNESTSSDVFAYITGLDINNNNAQVLLGSDGETMYHPDSPSEPLQPLTVDCGIQLGGPGSSRTVTIPQLAGGRIWFSIDKPLTFLLSPGPTLVEPSVTNPSDPNYNTRWHFCEFTFNSAQFFANISYVDFVCLPISLELQTSSGEVKRVAGTEADGLEKVADGLREQHNTDGAGWDSLIVEDEGQVLRVLSPNNALILNPSLFQDYWTQYVEEVWEKYSSGNLTINTQAAAGQVEGCVNGDELEFPCGNFAKPDAMDIFGCSSGPFAGGSADVQTIIPRLAAAFNRSTILSCDSQPSPPEAEAYYENPVTNHYARVVHEVNLDGRGYAFPYDDVIPDGGSDVAGTVFDADPVSFLVTVGGGDAHA